MKKVQAKNILLLLISLLYITNTQAVEKQTIGWLEHVAVGKQRLQFKAKIDTGADTTSIRAKILREFTIDDDDWIEFELSNQHGQSIKLQQKIERYVKIKRRLMPSIKRPVILLGVCLGKVYRNVEVNLAQRKNFKYSMLIGRNYLQGFYLVDSAETYTSLPTCTQ